MKCTESWLREWVNPKISLEKICDKLTMSGIEVEELAAVAKADYAAQLAKKNLKDHTIELSITPNRGDCLSVRGVAREIAAITKMPLKSLRIAKVKVSHKDKIKVKVEAKKICANYVGRIIRGVTAANSTPDWIRDRIITSGLKPINVIVDIANYVMLELGQPLHAFDLQKIKKEINVRMAKKNESITLLDGSTKKLNDNTLIIADLEKPLAIAGIMGSMDSGVSVATQDIFLESAYFSQATIAEQRQAYLLNSDAAHRFERGVDATIQQEAIERATQLILEYANGKAGPLIAVTNKAALPKAKTITLPDEKLQQILGITIRDQDVKQIFKALNFSFKRNKNNWSVKIPSYRFDLVIAEDLVEEIARLYGFDNIPAAPLKETLSIIAHDDVAKDTASIRKSLVDLSYHEIISYSFIDKDHQALLEPENEPLALQNPITAEMTVMRTSLWPGLINTMLYNQSRQQSRIRLFEIGTCFQKQGKTTKQSPKIAGLITGLAAKEQWATTKREVDFYDLKGDVETLLAGAGLASQDIEYKPQQHSALHPGNTAAIFYQGKEIGIFGALHPSIRQALKISETNIFVFEIDINKLFAPDQKRAKDLSKFPEIRRDIAILINQTIPADKIQATIREVVGTWLKDVFIFDVYAGKGIPQGFKSIALAIVLQHPTRTLVDEEVVTLMDRVTTTLKVQLGAELRS